MCWHEPVRLTWWNTTHSENVHSLWMINKLLFFTWYYPLSSGLDLKYEQLEGSFSAIVLTYAAKYLPYSVHLYKNYLLLHYVPHNLGITLCWIVAIPIWLELFNSGHPSIHIHTTIHGYVEIRSPDDVWHFCNSAVVISLSVPMSGNSLSLTSQGGWGGGVILT